MPANGKPWIGRVALGALLATGFGAAATLAVACVDRAPKGEAVTFQRDAGATATGQRTEFHVMGAGWFSAAEIVKDGGSNDATYVIVELDGAQVMNTSFVSLKNPMMELGTPNLVAKVRSDGSKSVMTIWYGTALKFRGIAAVRVAVQEDGVAGLRIRAVMNKPGPHEDKPGQPIAGQPLTLALPAFE